MIRSILKQNNLPAISKLGLHFKPFTFQQTKSLNNPYFSFAEFTDDPFSKGGSKNKKNKKKKSPKNRSGMVQTTDNNNHSTMDADTDKSQQKPPKIDSKRFVYENARETLIGLHYLRNGKKSPVNPWIDLYKSADHNAVTGRLLGVISVISLVMSSSLGFLAYDYWEKSYDEEAWLNRYSSHVTRFLASFGITLSGLSIAAISYYAASHAVTRISVLTMRKSLVDKYGLYQPSAAEILSGPKRFDNMHDYNYKPSGYGESSATSQLGNILDRYSPDPIYPRCHTDIVKEYFPPLDVQDFDVTSPYDPDDPHVLTDIVALQVSTLFGTPKYHCINIANFHRSGEKEDSSQGTMIYIKFPHYSTNIAGKIVNSEIPVPAALDTLSEQKSISPKTLPLFLKYHQKRHPELKLKTIGDLLTSKV